MVLGQAHQGAQHGLQLGGNGGFLGHVGGRGQVLAPFHGPLEVGQAGQQRGLQKRHLVGR